MGKPETRGGTLIGVAAAGVMLLAACGGSESGSSQPTEASSGDSLTTTAVPATTAASTEDPATTAAPTTLAPTSTDTTLSALETDEGGVIVRWGELASEPFYASAGDGADPLFHVHTLPETEGFFLSFEMYTTGYGAKWTGETGLVEISCDSPATSTGICVYFDPDGPGPEPVKGEDFQTTGSLTISQLDASGYAFEVHELIFSDGTTFQPFTVTG